MLSAARFAPMMSTPTVPTAFVGASVAQSVGPPDVLTPPPGSQPGDLMIVAVTYGGLTLASFPPGWTVLTPVVIESATNQTIQLAYKMLGGSDISSPGSITAGYSAAHILKATYRGPTSIVSRMRVQDEAGTTVTFSGGYTPAGAGGTCTIVSDRDGSFSSVAPSGFNGRASGTTSGIYGLALADLFSYAGGTIQWTGMQNAGGRVQGGIVCEFLQ